MTFAYVILLVMLLFVEKLQTDKGVCILKMVNGKLQKYGDCGSKQQSWVLKDLKAKAYKKSCDEIAKNYAGKTTAGGVFDVYPESFGGELKVEVYCDLETDGGGWTVFQRRMDGSEDFYRGWDDYVNGFGRRDKEFWLGLENLHQMTKNGKYELRVEIGDFYENTAYAIYGSFSIGSSAEKYRINVGSYSGTAEDELSHNDGEKFTTKDRDNDAGRGNCARSMKGAWWYGNCSNCNLNGLYHKSVGSGATGVFWRLWKGDAEYLKFTEMKFRKIE